MAIERARPDWFLTATKDPRAVVPMRNRDRLEVLHALEDARGALNSQRPRPLVALERIERALSVMDAVTE